MTDTGIFRKVLKLDGSSDSFYAMEELSQEDKKFIDKINASAMQQNGKLKKAVFRSFIRISFSICITSLHIKAMSIL